MNGAVNRDYDDILRRALHAAAESVEPSADGLERIRERLGHPPLLSFSSIAGWYSVAAVRFTGWAVPAFGTACEIFWALIDRFRPLDSPPGHAKPGLRWLRPLTATGLAIFVVAAGAFAAMAIPRISASDAGRTTTDGGSGGGQGGGPGRSAVHGSSPLRSNSGSPGYSSGVSPTSTAARGCHLSVSPSGAVTPTPGTSQSSVPATLSSTPTPTSTSPSPSTSTSPSPTTSGSSTTEPSSGITGTGGSAQATSAATSTSPGASSSSPGSASAGSTSPSGTTSPGGNNAAGKDLTASPGGNSSTSNPCPSSTPSSTATHKMVRGLGLGQPILVISSAGHFVRPAGRETF